MQAGSVSSVIIRDPECAVSSMSVVYPGITGGGRDHRRSTRRTCVPGYMYMYSYCPMNQYTSTYLGTVLFIQ